MASNFLPAREIVCVSLHKDKRTILAPYAFELAGNETFSQLLENLYIAGVKDKLNTIQWTNNNFRQNFSKMLYFQYFKRG